MKVTNVFLVHTEYHLLNSINIIFAKYKECNNYIYVTKGRIQRDFVSKHPFIVFRYLQRNDYGTKKLIKEFRDLNISHFFYFQEDSSDNIYLAYYCHKMGIPLSLVQDGTKPYHCYHKRHLILSLIKDTLIIYKEMILRKAVIPAFVIQNYYTYAHTKYLTDIWLTFPQQYRNNTNKTIVQIPDYSKESIDELKYLFDFNLSSFDKNAILYLGQPLHAEYRDEEVLMIKELMAKFPDKKLLYKIHPLTSKEQINAISEIDNVSVFIERIPAELLILSMNNTLIISMCSTSMLTHNPNCKFYWTHKLFSRGRFLSQIAIGNPTSYIKEVENIDEITD